MADQAERLESRTLGDFVIREEIGRGGFGMVYRAEQTSLGREAVIKILRAPLRRASDMADRFLREARLASQLDHPYAAHVYAFGAEDDGLLWIAMELVRGTPLDKLLAAQGPLPLERLVPLLERICEVVHTAHDQGIVHRDLKPANVMVISRAGRLLPKLLDFGIAKAIGMVAAEVAPAESEPRTIASIDARALANDATMQAQATPPAWSAAGLASRRASTPPGGTPNLRTDAITGRGSMIGSPPYMAPEQWLDATAATARSDLYSLGIVIYEVLTGQVPFRARTLMALAREHAQATPPSVGPSFPPAVDAVIARALAKSPADRYGSVLELAQAMREAAGLDSASTDEVVDDDPVLEAFIREAPEPIAEAALAVVAARHPFQARDAVALLGAVVLRWLGTTAIACRSRLGAPPDGDSPRARELLRALRRRVLEPLEWLELARELVRGYRGRAEAYPLPWLVDAVASAELEAAATEVLGVTRATGRSADTRSVRAAVAAVRPELARLLAAIRQAIDTPLIVIRDGHAESRMGAARSRRTRLAIRGAVPAEGAVALLDADGAPMVLLSPVVQAGVPAPGRPDEIFVFAGAEAGAAGRARLVSTSDAELHDDTVWGWLGTTVIDSTSGERADVAGDERAPYPGLTSFTASDADLFFGREAEVERVLNRVRAEPLVAIIGASGVGKSSFVAAGLVPAFPASWRTISFRPGASPIAAMTGALGRAVGGDYRGAGSLVSADINELIARARAETQLDGTTLVIIVDQLEELFTLCRDPRERDRFGEALTAAARTAEDRLRVVVTLRDDFLARTNEITGLCDRMSRAVELLAIPNRAALLRIVTAPAERVGYTFDDPALPARIVDDVADAPGALALLAFTVGRLWEYRDRHFHRLLESAYRDLGGVGGALAKHADHVLAQLSTGDQRLVRDAFRQLVTADGTRAVLTRAELARSLGGDARVDEVIERLIAARLLVTTETGEDDAMQIEVVHEALLVAWPRLVAWRREDAEGARLRDQIRAAAKQWDERGRPAGLLWRDDALAEYELWRARHPGALGTREEAFAAASLAQATRSRRRRRVAVAAAFVALVAGLATVGAFYRRASAAKARTSAQLAASFVERGRRALLDGNSLEASLYLDRARELGASGPGLDFMTARALPAIEARVADFTGHVGKVHAAVFSPDGTKILTAGADHTARIWDVSTGRQLAVLSGHTGEVHAAMFTADGRLAVTCSYDGTARLWDAGSGARIGVLPTDGPLQGVPTCAVSTDGSRLAIGGFDGRTTVWSIADQKQLLALGGHQGPINAVAFTRDGARVATASADGSVRLWDGATGRELAVLPHDGPVLAVTFSANGTMLASAGWDRTIKLWDAASGTSLRAFIGHTDWIESLAWSPDDKQLLSASRDDSAKLWDASTGVLLASLPHRGYVAMARFSPDGRRAVTASGDGSARVWELPAGTLLASLEGHGAAVWVGRFDAAGRRVLTASWDGTAKLWNPEHGNLVDSLTAAAPRGAIVAFAGPASVATLGMGGPPQIWSLAKHRAVALPGHDGVTTDLVASHDGRYAVTSGRDGDALVFDAESGHQIGRLVGDRSATNDIGISADDRRLVTSSADGTVRIWDAQRAWAGGDMKPLATVREPTGAVLFSEVSPDGRRVVSITAEGVASVWDTASGTRTTSLRLPGRTNSVSFSPDGRRFAAAGSYPDVVVFGAEDGQRLAVASGHGGAVMSAEFSPDGSRLLTACEDGFARVFDAGTGRLVGVLAGHASHVWHATWSPAGTLIATTSVDRTVKVWDAHDLTLIGSFAGHTDAVTMASFDRSGSKLVSTSWDGHLRVWDVSGAAHGLTEQLHACMPMKLEGTKLLPQVPDPARCRWQ